MKKKIYRILLLFFILLLPAQISAQSEAGMLFQLISPSPQANGMGGVYTIIDSPDPMSPVYNPAYLGILAQECQISIGFYIKGTKWLPNLAKNVIYDCKSLNFGFSLDKFHLNLPISLGIGLNQIKMDYGEQRITSETGPDVIGTFNSWDKSHNFSLSVSFDTFLKGSIGWSFKDIESHLAPNAKASVTAHDFGMALQLPVFESISKFGINRSFQGVNPFFVPAFWYSKNNIGDDKIIYLNFAQADPLPRVARIGFGFSAGIYITDKTYFKWKLISLEWGTQAEDLLVDRRADGTWNYKSGLGEINFFHDLVHDNINDQIIKMKGWQLNFFDFIYIRNGSHEDIQGKVTYKTAGLGLSTKGIFNIMRNANLISSSHFILNHIDVQYNESKVMAASGHPVDETTFQGISIFVAF